MIGKGKALIVHDDCMVSRVPIGSKSFAAKSNCARASSKMPQTCQRNTAASTKSRQDSGLNWHDGTSTICWRTLKTASLHES